MIQDQKNENDLRMDGNKTRGSGPQGQLVQHPVPWANGVSGQWGTLSGQWGEWPMGHTEWPTGHTNHTEWPMGHCYHTANGAH